MTLAVWKLEKSAEFVTLGFAWIEFRSSARSESAKFGSFCTISKSVLSFHTAKTHCRHLEQLYTPGKQRLAVVGRPTAPIVSGEIGAGTKRAARAGQ
ncbi:MAG TPA: hypothetical protein VLA52_08795, partial [Thermohalobaculum sp.]|nr:hypothetical protein [Thermohalobaculum sp.]